MARKKTKRQNSRNPRTQQKLIKPYYKTIKIRKNQTRKPRKNKGGNWFGVKEITNELNADSKNPNRKFSTIVSYEDKWQIFSSAPKYKIEYMVPNAIGLNNAQRFRVPDFTVLFNNSQQICNILIEDKYINFLVYVYDININPDISTQKINDFTSITGLYAMMRLGSLTLNPGLLATWTNNDVFYRLDPTTVVIYSDNNNIKIEEKYCEPITETDKNRKNKLLQNQESIILKLKPGPPDKLNYISVTNANKPIYELLKKFRRERLISYKIKEKAAEEVAEFGVETVIGAFIK
jgi:hypothetical protein